jgi:hypothetical protein
MAINQPTVALDENGDIYLDQNGNIAMINGVAGVAQTVSTALSLWLGEYDFNTTIGMPYNAIMGETLDQLLLYSYVKDVVSNVAFVTKVTNIDFVQDREKRITTITVEFDTTDSKGTIVNATI